MTRAFELDDVSVGYGGEAVVSHLSLSVHPGEVHCLLGPNGVGKTTVFRSALGFMPLISGRVMVDGVDAADLSDRELARRIAYVPQAAEVPFAYAVRDVVVMGRLARIGMFASPGAGDRAVVDRVLAELDIERLADKLYTELSGGERQMVLVARALAQEPGYLLMDEPTAALDLGNQARVLRAVRKLADRGIGILMTTHTPDHLAMCDGTGTLIMPDGTYMQGSAGEILDERVLRRAYTTSVMVVETSWHNRRERFCRPVVD